MATTPSDEVRKSAKFIASSAKYVHIDTGAIEELARKLCPQFGSKLISKEPKPCLEPGGLSEELVLEWTFLLDVLNFCFWGDIDKKGEGLFTFSYQGVRYTGYRSMRAALCKAVEVDNIPIYSPPHYRNITLNLLKAIFKSETSAELPLLQERMENLREAAAVLEEEFDGKVSELVARSNGSAQTLVHLLQEHFSSFRDVATYGGRKVFFLKRAQIFAANLWQRFEGQSYGKFHDIDSLTMFADYRVPQCLLYLGVLHYTEDLWLTVQSGSHLCAGEDREVEIRGCSIWAVELLKQNLTNILKYAEDEEETTPEHEVGVTKHEVGVVVNAALIDFYLWNYAKDHSDEMSTFPIHRTYSIFY